MKKLLLLSVLMLAFGLAHAFTNEDPYYTSWLGEMNQEDYVCGSIQFSIRPKDGWVVWKQKNMPFETSRLTKWAPMSHMPPPFNPSEGAPKVFERRFRGLVWS